MTSITRDLVPLYLVDISLPTRTVPPGRLGGPLRVEGETASGPNRRHSA